MKYLSLKLQAGKTFAVLILQELFRESTPSTAE